MKKLIDRYRRKGHRPKIYHLIADTIRIELHAYRILHPGIGNKNPPGRNRSSQSGKPGRSKMKTFAYLFPSKKHDSNECGFHKESKNSFDCKWGTENVAYKPRIIAPVGSEFKLEYQTGSYSDGKVYTKKFHPKLSGILPEFLTRFVIQRFHDTHHYCQSESERNKNPMVHGGHCKLGSRPINQ